MNVSACCSDSKAFKLGGYNPMDQRWNISSIESVRDTLKCFFCEKFLSVAPIYNHDFETICGRCKFVNKSEDAKWTRQSLYETLAQHLIFPCSNVYYGCNAQLKWGEVEEHENTCLFKKLHCPFSNDDLFSLPKCKWTGSGPGLNEHLESCHGDFIKKLPEINLSETKSNSIFLAKILKQLMIITIQYKPPSKFSCLIMINGTSTDCDAYRYQLELYDGVKKNSVILRRSRLEDAVGFEENLINEDKVLSFDLDIIKGLLKSETNVIGRFGIIKKSKREIYYGEKTFSGAQEYMFDENFLRELECPICKHYMTSPIHICVSGHSFCQMCFEQMTACPTCREPFEDGRNYTLEKLAACINYPCSFRESGCTVAGTSDKIKEHELDCSFSGVECFFSCSKGSVMNMFKHLKDVHHNSLINSGELQILDVSEHEVSDLLKFYAMCFGSDIFRIAVTYDMDFKLSLQQFGVSQNSYSFELEIVCTTDCSDKIIMGKECLPLNIDLWESSVELPNEIIQKYISEDELIFFKIHLKKNA